MAQLIVTCVISHGHLLGLYSEIFEVAQPSCWEVINSPSMFIPVVDTAGVVGETQKNIEAVSG